MDLTHNLEKAAKYDKIKKVVSKHQRLGYHEDQVVLSPVTVIMSFALLFLMLDAGAGTAFKDHFLSSSIPGVNEFGYSNRVVKPHRHKLLKE